MIKSQGQRVALAGLRWERLPSLLYLAAVREKIPVSSLDKSLILNVLRQEGSISGGFIAASEITGLSIVPFIYVETHLAEDRNMAFDNYLDCICSEIKATGHFDAIVVLVDCYFITSTRSTPQEEVIERIRSIVDMTVPVISELDWYHDVNDSFSSSTDKKSHNERHQYTDYRAIGAQLASRILRRVSGKDEYKSSELLFKVRNQNDVKSVVNSALALRSPDTGRAVILFQRDLGCSDSVILLRELIRRGVRNAAVFFIWDPVAAIAASISGPGAEVTLQVGGRSSKRAGKPVITSGVVRFAGVIEYTSTTLASERFTKETGLAAIIDIDGLMLLIVSQPVQTVTEEIMSRVGMRIADFELVILSSQIGLPAPKGCSSCLLIADFSEWRGDEEQ